MKLFDHLEKKQLDEMQDRTMLRIERNGCWLAFWGLLALFMIQMLCFGYDWKVFGGEFLLLMVMAAYLTVSTCRAGLWSRRTQPSVKTNVLSALCSGVVVFAFLWLLFALRYERPLTGLLMGAAGAAVSFGLTLLLLQISMKEYCKRRKELDDGDEPEA